MEVATFLLSKEHDPTDTSKASLSVRCLLLYIYRSFLFFSKGHSFLSYVSFCRIIRELCRSHSMDLTLKMQRSCTLEESHWTLQRVKRPCANMYEAACCISEQSKKCVICARMQVIRTTWKSSTVRPQPPPQSRKQDTFLQIPTEFWTLLSLGTISVSNFSWMHKTLQWALVKGLMGSLYIVTFSC